MTRGSSVSLEDKEGDGTEKVPRQLVDVERGLSGKRGRDRQRQPENDVFQYGHAKHEPCESGVQDLQIRENL